MRIGFRLLAILLAPALARAAPLSPALLDRVARDREVATSVSATRTDSYGKTYVYQSWVLVDAAPREVRRRLADLGTLRGLSRFVTRSDWDAGRRRLSLGGALWRFQFDYEVEVIEASSHALRFEVVSGAPRGASGEVALEPWPGGSTLVSASGRMRISRWIPETLVRKGAEAVLRDALRKLREALEK